MRNGLRYKERELRNIDDLLSRLYTDEGRYKVLTILAEKNLLNGSKYADGAIEYYKNKGSYFDAAMLAEEMGDKEKVREFYERGILVLEKDGIFSLAAKLCEDIGDIERAIKNYEKVGDFESSAILSEKVGDINRAIKNCEMAGQVFYKNKLLTKRNEDAKRANEFFERTIEFCDKNKRFNFAARLFEGIGDTEKAFYYYRKAKNFESIVILSKKIGNLERAIKICEIENSMNAENYIYAGELCEEIGDIKRAIKNYEKGKDFRTCVILSKKIGDIKNVERFLEKTIEFYEKEKTYDYVAKLFEWINNIEKANEFYKKEIKNKNIKDFKDLSIKSIRKKISILEKNYNFDIAAILAEKIGDINRAIKDYESTEWFAYAIKLAEKNNNIKRAIEVCEKGLLFDYAIKLSKEMGDLEIARVYKNLKEIIN